MVLFSFADDVVLCLGILLHSFDASEGLVVDHRAASVCLLFGCRFGRSAFASNIGVVRVFFLGFRVWVFGCLMCFSSLRGGGFFALAISFSLAFEADAIRAFTAEAPHVVDPSALVDWVVLGPLFVSQEVVNICVYRVRALQEHVVDPHLADVAGFEFLRSRYLEIEGWVCRF